MNDEVRAATGGSLERVPTLVLDPPPADFEALLERRRKLGQDLLDEVWEGVYHMNPALHRATPTSPSSSRSCSARLPVKRVSSQ